MEISNLLSPCAADAPRQRARAPVSAAVNVDEQLAALDEQIAALQRSSPPRKVAARVVVTTKRPTKQQQQQQQAQQAPTVQRKRKQRLSAKQRQAKHENQIDDSQLYNLTLDINELKQQVRDYTVHKSIVETRSLVARQRFVAGVVRTTQHYFNLLRTGYRQFEPQEAAFFAATFDRDLVIKSEPSSVEELFNKWRMYKHALQMRYFGISSIRVLVSDVEGCVVECEGEFEGRLTLAAITRLFPHILQDQQLLASIVDRPFVCPTRTLVYFDAGGRIVEYNAHADLFAGLSRVMASKPMDVITLLSEANVGQHSSSTAPHGNESYGSRSGEPKMVNVTSESKSCDDVKWRMVPASPASSTASSSSSMSPSSSSSSGATYSSRSSVKHILP